VVLSTGLHPLLASLASLQCSVLFSLVLETSVLRPVWDDERFMHLSQTDFCKDWFDLAKGGGGYWGLAEAFVSARRAGKVDRECLLMPLLR
jgi:hypothetical protein